MQNAHWFGFRRLIDLFEVSHFTLISPWIIGTLYGAWDMPGPSERPGKYSNIYICVL
jgi:hypothetical protein